MMVLMMNASLTNAAGDPHASSNKWPNAFHPSSLLYDTHEFCQMHGMTPPILVLQTIAVHNHDSMDDSKSPIYWT